MIKKETAVARALQILNRHYQGNNGYNATNIRVATDINIPGNKVLKVDFQDNQTAAHFAQFAQTRAVFNNTVILTEQRTKQVFTALGEANHGKTKPRPKFNAIVYEDSIQSGSSSNSFHAQSKRKNQPVQQH